MKHTEPKYAGCKVVVSTHELALHGIMTLNYIQKKAGLFSGIGTRPGSFSVNKVNVAVARRNVKTKKKIKNVRNADAVRDILIFQWLQKAFTSIVTEGMVGTSI